MRSDPLSSGAPRDYYAHSGRPKFADRYGFALVLPQTSGANNANSSYPAPRNGQLYRPGVGRHPYREAVL